MGNSKIDTSVATLKMVRTSMPDKVSIHVPSAVRSQAFSIGVQLYAHANMPVSV